MKINQNKSSKNRILLAIAAVAVLLLSYGMAAYAVPLWPFHKHFIGDTSISIDKPTDQQKQAGATIKAQNATNSSSTASKGSPTTGSDPTPAPVPDPSSNNATVGVDITSSNVYNGTLMLRTLIQYVTTTGTCNLTMIGPNGAQYAASAGIQPSSSTSSCKGFNIPMSSLSSGKWTAIIKFTGDSVTGSTTKDITL